MTEGEVYAQIGDEGVRRLVGAFYAQVPGDDLLGPMYPQHDLKGAEERLGDFLVDRLGGPPTYARKRGHPRLRMRHAPFPLDRAARDRWVLLMERAIAQAALPDDVAVVLRNFFDGTATFLMNR